MKNEYTEIMGQTNNDALILEKQDNGSLMVEVIPLELGQQSARLYLDGAGQKRLMEFLTNNRK